MTEVKPRAMILMHSGMQNPEKELTNEELEHIQSLVAQLNDIVPQQHGHFGHRGYAANWEEAHVITYYTGHVSVYTDKEEKHYYDTTGVMAYLCQLLTPVMVQYSKDAQKVMDDWVAAQVLYQPPPWEPNF